MSLRSIVRRALQLYSDVRVELHEAFELPGDQGTFRAKRRSGEREDSFVLALPARTGSEQEQSGKNGAFRRSQAV